MLEYLEQLRKKPLSYRKRFLALTTTGITAVIVILWISTFGVGFGESVSPKLTEDNLKPIEELKTGMSSFFAAVKDVSENVLGGFAATTSASEEEGTLEPLN